MGNNYTVEANNRYFYGLILPANIDSYWNGGVLRVTWTDIYTPDVQVEVYVSEEGTAPYELKQTTIKGATSCDIVCDNSKSQWVKIRVFKDNAYSGFSLPVVVTPPYVPLIGYFVKNGGNDALDGRSDATAWATLAKVQSTNFVPGDNIYFKRGDTFRGSLNKVENGLAGNYISYGAYGAGNRPLILGSKDISAGADWVNHAGNIWKTTATLGTNRNDISNLIFNNEASTGVKRNSLAGCINQGDFFYNTVDDLVYLYSVGSPDTVYTHIEAAGNEDLNAGLLRWTNSSYINVNTLDVRYSSGAGIEFRDCSYGIIEHNSCSFIGGTWFNAPTDVRLGNGISLVRSCSNFEIRYNVVSQCFDAGISPQGWDVYTMQNINTCYNIITNCWYSYELIAATGSTYTGVNCFNNTMVYAGTCWSASQRGGSGGNAVHFECSNDTGTVTNCRVFNNIFAHSTDRAIRYGYSANKFRLDYNLYFDFVTCAATGVGTFATLALWQAAAVLQDQHSISADPLFVGAADFHLQAGSPAIAAGLNVGLNYDMDGVAVADPPAIGCYEA